MIPKIVQQEIIRRLHAAELEHGVRVVLAVESGSRAWGFESSNSDYDARFIYAHPKDWYLSIGLEEQRDVIEYKIVDEIDINGWDLRKALRLYLRSNPAFVEWVQSPVIYLEHCNFSNMARGILPAVYSCEKGIYHYKSMAKTNFRGYLRADLVPLKKYFYVLRPLLAVRWLEQYKTAAPVEFSKLLGLIEDNDELLSDIKRLLRLKKSMHEMGEQKPIASINTFIEKELQRLDEVAPKTEIDGNALAEVNALFHQTLNQLWV